MNTPHTPGPWTAEDQSGTDVHFFTIRSPQNCYIAGLHEYDGQTTPAMASNARLLAAAPELLEALESFLRAPSVGSNGPGSSTIVVQDFNLRAARAAILKATTPDK